MKHSKKNSLKILCVDLATTKVIKGSGILYKTSLMLNYIILFVPFLSRPLRFLINRLPNEEVVIQNKKGRFNVNIRDETTLVCSLYFEYFLDDWLDMKEKDIFIDVGANLGVYSIRANQKKYRHIYSFEPNPPIYNLLIKNIALNRIKNVKLINKGLSDRKKIINFHSDKITFGQSKVLSNNELGKYKKENIIKVPVEQLDQYTTNLKRRCFFIKIDVEGHELEVLQGMKDTMKNMKEGSRIAIEIWHTSSNTKKIVRLLNQYGFRQKEIREDDYLFEKNA